MSYRTEYDHTTWIKRMILGNFEFITEDWIKKSYANSVAADGHNPLQDLLILYRAVKIKASRPKDPAEESIKIEEAKKFLRNHGYKITHPVTDAISLLDIDAYKIEFRKNNYLTIF